jgi:iron complex outermembrane receptor protein
MKPTGPQKNRLAPRILAHAVSTVFACGGMTAALAQETQSLQRVEITGSNIKRIEGETALPVQVITREEIQKSGSPNVESFLQTLGVAVQGNSNTVAGTTAGSNAGSVSSVSLRGLGSQRTLVLINGRRVSAGGTLTDSTTVDVGNIPLSALERIEVLKDGASAIYGSDAIGGVINFILRKDYKKGEFTLYGGGTQDGGGAAKRINGSVGFGDMGEDRFNVTLVGSHQVDNSLYGRDRRFANTAINEGALNDTTSGNTFPGNILAADGSFGTSNPLAPNNCSPSVTSPLFPSSRCRYDPAPQVALLPEIEQTSLFGSARFALTPEMEAYAEASYARKKTKMSIQPAPISDQFNIPNSNPLASQAPYNAGNFAFATILLNASSPYYPTSYVQNITGGATPDLLVRYRSYPLGPREFTDYSEQPRVVLGLKGTFASWDYDASFLHTKTKLTEVANSGIGLYTRVLPLLNSGQVNPFGASTPAVEQQLKDTLFHGVAYQTESSIDSISAKLSRELMKLSGGSMAMALGAEARREKFSVDTAPELQIGDTTHYGGDNLPVDKSRNVTAFFAELSAPVLKSLELNAAVRYDNYQGTGSKTTPKVGVRWQPAKEVLVRSSWGKGFRAPSLTELYQPQTSGVSAQGLTDPLRCPTTSSSNDCETQFNIRVGGKSTLKSEESTNITAGIVLEPTSTISLAFDAFAVKLTNRIIFGIQPSAILADQVKYGSLITRGPVDAAFPNVPGPITSIDQINLNLGETKVRGLDVDWKFKFPLAEAGSLQLGLNGTYFDKYEIQNVDGSKSSIVGVVSPIVQGDGGVIPRWHHYLTLDWKMGAWTAGIAQNYQRGYTDIAGTFEDATDPAFKARRVSEYVTYDIQGSYAGFKNTKINFGVRNLLNTDPPYTNAGGQNYFQSGYDPGYADPRGRFFYASLTYAFK